MTSFHIFGTYFQMILYLYHYNIITVLQDNNMRHKHRTLKWICFLVNSVKCWQWKGTVFLMYTDQNLETMQAYGPTKICGSKVPSITLLLKFKFHQVFILWLMFWKPWNLGCNSLAFFPDTFFMSYIEIENLFKLQITATTNEGRNQTINIIAKINSNWLILHSKSCFFRRYCWIEPSSQIINFYMEEYEKCWLINFQVKLLYFLYLLAASEFSNLFAVFIIDSSILYGFVIYLYFLCFYYCAYFLSIAKWRGRKCCISNGQEGCNIYRLHSNLWRELIKVYLNTCFNSVNAI